MSKHDIKFISKLQQASDFTDAGKYLHAIQIYVSLLEKYGADSLIVFPLYNIYLKLNNFTAAKNLLKMKVESNPEDISFRILYSSILTKMNDWNEALNELKLISSYEDSIVDYMLGEVYFNLKNYDKSINHFLKYINQNKINEFYELSVLRIAEIKIYFNEFDDALKFLNKIETLSQANFKYHFLKAKIYYNLSMTYNASSAIKRALKLNPNDGNLLLTAARIFYNSKEFDKCIKCANDFFLYQEDISSEIYFELGKIIYEIGDKKIGMGYIHQAYKLDFDNEEVYNFILDLEENEKNN